MMDRMKCGLRIVTSVLALLLCLPALPAAAEGAAREKAVAGFLESHQLAMHSSLGYVARMLQPVYIHTSLAERSMDELLSDSTVIATGKITGGPHGVEIEHATVPGLTRIYSEYDFTIDQVLKGQPYAETVSVRVLGGSVGLFTEVYDGSPQLNQEDEYLLFLVNENCGGAYHTEGDYYRLFGQVQGAYVLGEDAVYRNVGTGEELPGEALISPHLEEEPDPDYYREKQLETYRGNYERGMDSLEEYKENVRSLDQYAKIVKKAD